jgi:hypothetical protein
MSVTKRNRRPPQTLLRRRSARFARPRPVTTSRLQTSVTYETARRLLSSVTDVAQTSSAPYRNRPRLQLSVTYETAVGYICRLQNQPTAVQHDAVTARWLQVSVSATYETAVGYTCRLRMSVTYVGYISRNMCRLHMSATYVGYICRLHTLQHMPVTHVGYICRLHMSVTYDGYNAWPHVPVTSRNRPGGFIMLHL